MAKAKILIVEDERIVAKDIQNTLKKQGFVVSAIVPSGEEALNKVNEKPPDLVLMDIVLEGEMDGTEAADQIRTQFNIPVVYLTAYADEKLLERAKITEPFGYIIKPFDDRELNIAIEMALYKHKMEKRLKEREEWFSTTLRSIGDAVIATDTEGYVTFMNPVAQSLTGWSQEEAIGKPLKDVFNIINEETGKQVENPASKVIREGFVVGLANHTVLIAKDGTEIPIADSGSPIRDEMGDIIGVVLVFRDIRERKEAEKALRASEEKYRVLVENANDAIFIAQDEVVKFPNPETLKMIGYSADELARISFDNLIHPEDREMVLERHKRRLKGEELPDLYSFRIINRAGEELWVQLNTVLITWEDRPATLNFLRDITQQKKMEAQFQQAQRMEALGTLAGGISHDFNNLLMGIQGCTSLMLMNADSSHPHFGHLKGIENYVKSAADLTKQLLGFARSGKYEVKPTDLNELIKRTSRMFGRTKKEIKIHWKYQKDIWAVEADQGQVEQVFLNLYVNAWQAMPGGGELYLETENVTLDEDYVRPFDVEPGNYVKISVTDTGMGMDEATQQRIFEPFFTTREMGRGTGLGLASVYGIIKNHGGFINVYSVRGEGTTFNIYLPTSEKDVKEEKKVSEELLKGTETILLIDDEDMIIDVGSQMLKALGYEVLSAGSGKEAMDIYTKNKDKIDMVILDMIMPDMSGGETYDRLKEINPGIKVLLSSGYSINGQAKEILGRGCDGFIQKPFNMIQLSRKVRGILDKE